MSVDRVPALRRPQHPADDIPPKPERSAPPPPPPAVPLAERLIEQHNVRIRPSTKERLGRAVDKLRYETGDRSISIASITDEALREYLDRHGC
ncbi:hypothetical protein [Nocardia sp. NBC_01388]|uniref:hypothetical protein n=1 Tax=Nocardia sp. NBC_01388 TaxID=2903596 RepID=UPI002F90CA18